MKLLTLIVIPIVGLALTGCHAFNPWQSNRQDSGVFSTHGGAGGDAVTFETQHDAGARAGSTESPSGAGDASQAPDPDH